MSDWTILLVLLQGVYRLLESIYLAGTLNDLNTARARTVANPRNLGQIITRSTASQE